MAENWLNDKTVEALVNAGIGTALIPSWMQYNADFQKIQLAHKDVEIDFLKKEIVRLRNGQ
ncbi:MAG: hypothetical protein KGI27_09835 [Thaumarchaeota archaeon]|nr:hypothetical protein [Nitrososphaerota archaeon]